jgi:hypothetical protein
VMSLISRAGCGSAGPAGACWIPAPLSGTHAPAFYVVLGWWRFPFSLVWLGYCESFSGKLHDERLNREIFYTMKEAQIVIENWRRHYNTVRRHSSPEYRPPAPEALVWQP